MHDYMIPCREFGLADKHCCYIFLHYNLNAFWDNYRAWHLNKQVPGNKNYNTNEKYEKKLKEYRAKFNTIQLNSSVVLPIFLLLVSLFSLYLVEESWVCIHALCSSSSVGAAQCDQSPPLLTTEQSQQGCRGLRTLFTSNNHCWGRWEWLSSIQHRFSQALWGFNHIQSKLVTLQSQEPCLHPIPLLSDCCPVCGMRVCLLRQQIV